jgi:ribosomal protein L23
MHRKARSRGQYAGYTAAWKKAIVTLAPGQAIEIFQGI